MWAQALIICLHCSTLCSGDSCWCVHLESDFQQMKLNLFLFYNKWGCRSVVSRSGGFPFFDICKTAVEYFAQSWVPWHRTDIGRWEQVQQRAVKMAKRLEHRMNEVWLREQDLFSPKKARQGRIFYSDTSWKCIEKVKPDSSQRDNGTSWNTGNSSC